MIEKARARTVAREEAARVRAEALAAKNAKDTANRKAVKAAV